MKKVFSLFVLLCVTTLIFAQTETQTATLKHGDNITAYYGCDALINAYNNAEDGDIITLSGGGFNAPTITKTITLRGAGCISDPDLMTLPTTVIGYVQIDMETDEQTLIAEGITFENTVHARKLHNAIFIRCNFKHVYSGTNFTGLVDTHFINCIFYEFRTMYTRNLTFDNCILWKIWNNEGSVGSNYFVVNNCYMKLDCTFNNLAAYNCIIEATEGQMATDNCVVHNCISICSSGSVFECPHYNCYENKTFEEIFATFTGQNYVWTTEQLILKESAATMYLGTDGTEVGIHGGSLPYASRPTYMVPNSVTADHQTTPDGKLNVHINVISQNK